MASPIVSWYTRDNKSPLSNWNIGTIDAGTISSEFGFLIWNNRYDGASQGTTQTSIMTDCVIAVRDSAGGLEGTPLVTEQWVEVKVDTIGELEFTKIGATLSESLSVLSGGVSPMAESTYIPVEHAIQCDSAAFAEKCSETLDDESLPLNPLDYTSPIGGFINDGTKENAKANFSEFTMRIDVPERAKAGSITFFGRVRYSYV